ncbi:MAG: substrate-binding domain-containing protein [Oscillospiraceae bacterium]|jgi:phosphate transport system substrate-binding protein|nr:substrate-binding domain-containing protein [Oscillospiraceae bacterium]
MRKFVAVLFAVVLLFLLSVSCKKIDPAPDPVTETPTNPVTASETPVAPTVTPSVTPSVTPTASPTDKPVYDVPDNRELTALWERIDGSTATIPLTAALYDLISGGDWPPVHETTPIAYYNLINGNADLIFVTYPSENEFAMAREKGIELEIIPIVKDALVFLVNVENPVDNVSLLQLRDIYAGNIKNWSTLGGANGSIIPYQRTEDSGSQTLFLKLLMGGLSPMKPPSEWVTESMGGLVESVSYYDNAKSALGYSVFYFVNNMYGNSQFKLLGVNGVKPTRNTIISGKYPLDDCYYAVVRKSTPEDSPARTLVNWLLTDDGQKLATNAGYIPLRLPDDGASEETNAIDPIYLGDAYNSSGTGGTVLKADADDILTGGVRRPLSDMFFDGFNYVRYINDEIMAELNHIENEFFLYTMGEYYLMRPFPGIPNDYPNYELEQYYSYSDSRRLLINFPDGNPFFKPWDHLSNSRSYSIRLTEDISPYGVGLAEYSIAYDYDRRLLPNADLFTLSVSIPNSPAVADKINKRLKSWTDSFAGSGAPAAALKDFCDWCGSTAEDPYRLQPLYGRWRDYLSVSYIPQTYDGPSYQMPALYTICFDTKTGNTVNLADVLPLELPRDLDYSLASIFAPVSLSELETRGADSMEHMPDGYIPKSGAVITDAWIIYGRISLCLTEPDGRALQVFFWDEIE